MTRAMVLALVLLGAGCGPRIERGPSLDLAGLRAEQIDTALQDHPAARQLSWSAARAAMQASGHGLGQRFRSGVVVIDCADGSRLVTIEPSPDAIYRFLAEHPRLAFPVRTEP